MLKNFSLPVFLFLFFLTFLSLGFNPKIVKAQTGLTTGLVGFWRFNEGTGSTTSDSSNNGNNGTLVDSPSWTDGRAGKALSFDGVDDYVDVGKKAILNNLTSFTWSAWIYPRSWGEGGFGRIIGKTTDSGHEKTLYLGNNGTLRFYFFASTTNASAFSNTNTIVLNSWQHVAVTFNYQGDKKPHLYVNGQEVSYSGQTAQSGTPWNDSNYNLLIGNRKAQDRTFDGVIDEVRVYNRALTNSEIAQLVNFNITPASTNALNSPTPTSVNETVTPTSSFCRTEPADIVLALDRSGSMDKDFNGKKKLQWEKEAAAAFVGEIAQLPGIVQRNVRIAIVDWAGNVYRLGSINLTTDRSTVLNYLNNISVSSSDRLTCIECAVNRAARLLENSTGRKYVVLMSDGIGNRIEESCSSTNESSCVAPTPPSCTYDSVMLTHCPRADTEAIQAATSQKAKGVKFYVVGYGSKQPLAILEDNLKNISGDNISSNDPDWPNYYHYAPEVSRWAGIFQEISQEICPEVTIEPTITPTSVVAPSATASPTVFPTVTFASSPTATIALTTVTPQDVSPTTEVCPTRQQGDANCDGKTTGIDYAIWLNSQCRSASSGGVCSDLRADFNADKNVDDVDFQIWFNSRQL